MAEFSLAKLGEKLGQTWPARLANDAWGAVTLPGDVYQGNVSMYGEDGRTNPEVINRSMDLAGLATLGGIAGTGEKSGAVLGSGPIRRTYGGAADPTQTGWTFKDVAHPNRLMERGDWRAVTRATETGEGIANVELPIRSLNATQKAVNPDFANVLPRGDAADAPFVIKKNGQYFVQDGHHRLTAASEKGQQTAKVRLVDLDGTTQTQFPLLDRM